MIPGVDGFMYPNEVELQWSVLIVLYPYITGLVAGAFILASLERVFKVEAVRPTYRLALLTALAFLIVESAAQVVTIRRIEVGFRLLPACLVEWAEPTLDAVSVVAARVGPEDDLRRGVVELPADDDLVASPSQTLADLGLRFHGRRGSA